MFDQERYKETFDQVQASEETLSEVLKMAKKQNNNNHYGRRAARMLLVAVVACALLATTAFAYVGFTQYENPMELLRTFFGSDEYHVDQGGYVRTETYFDLEWDVVEPTVEHVPVDTKVAEEDVAPYVSDVGKSVTYGDYTLTVEAHLYDSATDCGVVYYTLENPNGVSGYSLQSDGEVWWPDGEKVIIQNCFGKNYIIENETTDTKLSVAHYYCGVYGDDNYIQVCFSTEEDGLILPLNDGGGMSSIMLAEGDILVSPISIRINAEKMDFLRQYDTDGTLLPPRVDNIESLVIEYKDGTEYVVEMDTDDQLTSNYTYVIQTSYGDGVSYTFNRLIDLDNVEKVIINETEFTDIKKVTRQQRDTVPETAPEQPPVTEPANH